MSTSPDALALADQRAAVYREVDQLKFEAMSVVGPGDKLRRKRDHVIKTHRGLFSTFDGTADQNTRLLWPGRGWFSPDEDFPDLAAMEAPRVLLSWKPNLEFVALSPVVLWEVLANVHVDDDAVCGWHGDYPRTPADAADRLILPLAKSEWLVLLLVCGGCVERVRREYGDASLRWLHPDDLAPEWSVAEPQEP